MQTAVHIETIRYYGRIAILPKPFRSGGGHKLYAERINGALAPHHQYAE